MTQAYQITIFETTKEPGDPGLPCVCSKLNGIRATFAVADIRDGFVRGEQALRSRLPDVKFEYNEDIRIPEVITPDVWKSNI